MRPPCSSAALARRALAAIATLAALEASGGCGSPAHPPPIGYAGDDASAPDALPGDALPGDAPVVLDAPVDAEDPASLFHVVGPLDGLGANVGAQNLALYDAHLYALATQLGGARRWALLDASPEALTFTGSSAADHTDGASCVIGSRVYLFGGGGNGLFGPWHVFEWTVADLGAHTFADVGTASWAAHYLTAVAHGAECVTLGGDPNPHGDVGSLTVYRVDPATQAWSGYRSMPVPRSYFAAALAGDTLLVTGGECSGAACPGAPTLPTTLASANVLSLAGPAEAWAPAANLPRPLGRHAMVALAGRFYLAGGTSDWQPPFTFRREVLSWAPGEAAWRQDGVLPAQATMIALRTDGTSLYLVGAVQGASFLYRAAL